MKTLIGLIVVIACSGCGEIYVGHRMTDEVEVHQKMNNRALKCMFVDCSNQKGS